MKIEPIFLPLEGGGLALANMNYLIWLILKLFKSVLEHVCSRLP